MRAEPPHHEAGATCNAHTHWYGIESLQISAGFRAWKKQQYNLSWILGFTTKKTDKRDLTGERGAESTMLGSVTCQAASLSTSCRAHMSWQHLPGLSFDPLKTRRGFGPLVEQPTSAKGKIQGWGKHLLGFSFWCFSNQRPEEPFYPQKNGCSCMKWLQTSASPPLLPLPLPSFLNINMNKITLSMITYAQ